MAFLYVHTILRSNTEVLLFSFVSDRVSCCSDSPQTHDETAEADAKQVILPPLTYNC